MAGEGDNEAWFSVSDAKRIVAATKRVESDNGTKPAPGRSAPLGETYTARCTSGTPNGSGFFDALIVRRDASGAAWVEYAVVYLYPANGETLVTDAHYECKPIGMSGTVPLYQVVGTASSDWVPFGPTTDNVYALTGTATHHFNGAGHTFYIGADAVSRVSLEKQTAGGPWNLLVYSGAVGFGVSPALAIRESWGDGGTVMYIGTSATMTLIDGSVLVFRGGLMVYSSSPTPGVAGVNGGTW